MANVARPIDSMKKAYTRCRTNDRLTLTLDRSCCAIDEGDPCIDDDGGDCDRDDVAVEDADTEDDDRDIDFIILFVALAIGISIGQEDKQATPLMDATAQGAEC
jgi:hypothetical protein